MVRHFYKSLGFKGLNDDNDDNEALLQQSKRNCVENGIAANHGRGCKFSRKSFVAFAKVKESQNIENLI